MPDTRALTKDEILDHLNRLSRGPFVDWMAEVMQAAPTAEDMKAYFAKYPDRAAQTMTQAAKLAGFNDRAAGGSTTNIFAIVAGASDAELMARLAKALEAIEGQKAPTTIIEQKPHEVPSNE